MRCVGPAGRGNDCAVLGGHAAVEARLLWVGSRDRGDVRQLGRIGTISFRLRMRRRDQASRRKVNLERLLPCSSCMCCSRSHGRQPPGDHATAVQTLEHRFATVRRCEPPSRRQDMQRLETYTSKSSPVSGRRALAQRGLAASHVTVYGDANWSHNGEYADAVKRPRPRRHGKEDAIDS